MNQNARKYKITSRRFKQQGLVTWKCMHDKCDLENLQMTVIRFACGQQYPRCFQFLNIRLFLLLIGHDHDCLFGLLIG